MWPYSKTAVALANAKEAALYFDYVIPLGAVTDVIAWMHNGYPKPYPLPRMLHDLLPPAFKIDSPCYDAYRRVASNYFSFVVTQMEKEALCGPRLLPQTDEEAFARELEEDNYSADSLVRLKDFIWRSIQEFLEHCDLTHVPLISTPDVARDDNTNGSDIAIAWPTLELIDVDNVPWEQILEFRADQDSRNRLRRFRLFAFENYVGKPRDYVEDDLLKRLEEYEETARRWGFETRNGILTMLFTSKFLAGAATGSVISALMGAPEIALSAAIGGVSLELGHISVQLSMRRFTLRNVLKDNPVSYVVHARDKLCPSA